MHEAMDRGVSLEQVHANHVDLAKVCRWLGVTTSGSIVWWWVCVPQTQEHSKTLEHELERLGVSVGTKMSLRMTAEFVRFAHATVSFLDSVYNMRVGFARIVLQMLSARKTVGDLVARAHR